MDHFVRQTLVTLPPLKLYSRHSSCLGIAVILIIIYTLFIQSHRQGFKVVKDYSSRLENVFENSMTEDDFVPTPCIEPHCETQCSVLYPSSRLSIKANIDVLSEEQREHFLIDAGLDKKVNDLINNYPSPKLCPYRAPKNSIQKIYANITVEYYPLSFGFNEHFSFQTIPKVVWMNGQKFIVNQTCLPIKTLSFSSLVPGRLNTYRFGFGQELDYRRMYGAACFAVTMKKGGWDCNRHYEIISSGTVPYFDDLEKAGLFTMAHLPKSLLVEARSMDGIDRKSLTVNNMTFNMTQYRLILHRLLYYSARRLTTRKLVEYIIRSVRYPMSGNHSILYISGADIDYMKEFMLHGFTLVFGKDVFVYNLPRFLYFYPNSRPWTFEETKNFYNRPMYGYGYAYSLLLRKYTRLYEHNGNALRDENILKKNIEARTYSLIVFGSIARHNLLFPFVIQYYNRSRIIVIDGEDDLKWLDRSMYAEKAFYFLREIPDKCEDFS